MLSRSAEEARLQSFAANERWNLLLLEEGEYYFRDHASYYWKDGKRVAGQLKVCSLSLYFVPRDIQEPIFRVPYKSTTALEELEGEVLGSGEGMFLVSSTERVDMKAGDIHSPYHRHKGQFQFRFSLVYTSLEEVLPAIEDLCYLAQVEGSKEERAAAKERLAEIIQGHEENERFNPGWLEDDNERVLVEMVGNCITPLCMQPGRVVLTQSRIYFQPFNVVSNAPIQTYQLDKVMFVMRRVHQLEDLGMEVFFPGRASLYLTFKTTADRESFIKLLMQQPNLQLEHMRSRDKWTKDWVNGRISNFDYLMYLNREAGRSFKDLTQYPVFPWVIADYTSRTLDLNDPTTFRDLSRPMGALNPDRLKAITERYTELKKMCNMMAAGKSGNGALSLDFPPAFMYGCHYSSPGYVVFYLMRSDPQLMLRLQNGRFDAPDRLFWSIQDTWKSVLTLHTDFKELIPEFYSNDASFLVNNDSIDFGTRSNGNKVDDVLLPPWATDAQDFVYKLAEALESPYVSSKLHKWINLVFGYKSRGAEAEAANNVFHYLTYDDIAAKFLEQERDPRMRDALRTQMMEFGRTPRQLFTRRHPKRKAGFGGAGLFACLACAPMQRKPTQVSNTLSGKGWAGRNITPVSRAVFKLTSNKPTRRAATLAWLEQTAAVHEPEVLTLKQGKGAELVVLVKFVRDAREGKNPHATGEEMTGILVRACKALSVAPQNRRHILDAGALDLLVDALCSDQEQLSLQAIQALAAVSVEDNPRLASVDKRALARVMTYLDRPAHSEGVLAALTVIANLASATPNRMFFTEHALLPRLLSILEVLSQHTATPRSTEAAAAAASSALPQQQQQQQASPQPAGSAAGSATGGASPSSVRRSSTLMRTAVSPRDPVDTQRLASLRQCVLSVAALLQDDAQKEMVLEGSSSGSSESPGAIEAASGSQADGGGGSSSGVDLILELCQSAEQTGVQGAAYECVAALTTYEPMWELAKERHLLPMLLQAATSGPPPVQRPAAAAVANLCADPQLVVGALEQRKGLAALVAALVAMSHSPDPGVQKHAARALWHLVTQPSTRSKVVRDGALSALLTLSRSAKRGVEARRLAKQALRACHDDPAVRPQLESAATAAGVELDELTASFTTVGRLSSHPSSGSLLGPSAASPATSGSIHLSIHRRQPSDLRSEGATEDVVSPGSSRWSSFNAPMLAPAPASAQASLRASSSQEEQATPRLVLSPQRPNLAAVVPPATAAATAPEPEAPAAASGTEEGLLPEAAAAAAPQAEVPQAAAVPQAELAVAAASAAAAVPQAELAVAAPAAAAAPEAEVTTVAESAAEPADAEPATATEAASSAAEEQPAAEGPAAPAAAVEASGVEPAPTGAQSVVSQQPEQEQEPCTPPGALGTIPKPREIPTSPLAHVHPEPAAGAADTLRAYAPQPRPSREQPGAAAGAEAQQDLAANASKSKVGGARVLQLEAAVVAGGEVDDLPLPIISPVMDSPQGSRASRTPVASPSASLGRSSTGTSPSLSPSRRWELAIQQQQAQRSASSSPPVHMLRQTSIRVADAVKRLERLSNESQYSQHSQHSLRSLHASDA